MNIKVKIIILNRFLIVLFRMFAIRSKLIKLFFVEKYYVVKDIKLRFWLVLMSFLIYEYYLWNKEYMKFYFFNIRGSVLKFKGKILL